MNAIPASGAFDLDDSNHLRALRAELPAVETRAYLNTGTAGPLPRAAAAAIQAELAHELANGRCELADFDRAFAVMARLRGEFGRLLGGAATDEIALTHHTSDGINIACWGLNWQPGDELLTTTLEHEGGLVPAYAAARRFGCDIRVADLGRGDDPQAMLDAVDAALTPRTRLLVISHVTWNTGAILPLGELTALAHRRGALVLVDGAQSIGAIPVDVRALGCDFYAIPGQKWLCGPEGIGALYVRRDRLSLLRPTFASYFSLRDFESWNLDGDFYPAAGARRFEVATVFRPALPGMLASLRFLDETVGQPFAYTRIAALAAHARKRIAALPGATVLTPERHAGLVAFAVEGVEPDAAMRALATEKIIIRSVPFGDRKVLRASTGFYNTVEEIERLCEGLLRLAR